jgi:lipopolysaccharide biosynthesis glycosyltransferase
MVKGVAISLASIAAHTQSPLQVIVLTAANRHAQAMQSADLDFLRTYLQKQATIRVINLTDQFNAFYPAANKDTIFTPFCMLRLFLDLVDDLPDKVLYLDTDIVARADIASLFEQEIENYDFAGVLDYYGKWFYHNQLTRNGFDYINSGVLLLNMRQIKAVHLFERCRHLCATKKMFLPDQEALNRLAKKKKFLPRKFNEQHKLRSDTVLQHFTTQFRFWPRIHTLTVKPWEVERVHNVLHLHEYDEVLNQYQKWYQAGVIHDN